MISLINPMNLSAMTWLAACAPPGCFVEVGVYRGGSAQHLLSVAEVQGRQLHLFDTFTGIPCKCEADPHEIGDFADVDYTAIVAALPGATFHPGLFPQSLAPLPPVAFAHIDVDQYESTRDACAALGPLMASNGVMLFDDVGCLEGATKALEETGWFIEYTENNKAYVRF